MDDAVAQSRIDLGSFSDGQLREMLTWAVTHQENLPDFIERSLSSEDKRRLLNVLLRVLWRTYRDEDAQRMRFEAGQAIGLHVLPVHFYSPIPNTNKLSASTWSQRECLGIDWREQAQIELLQRLSHWSEEMAGLTTAENGDKQAFHFNNDTFALTDAAALYAILREFRPRRMIEIGCGWSSLIASQAIRKQQTELIQIEPFTPKLLIDNPHLVERRLIEKPVQDVELDLFEGLGANDVLFIDSTHVSRIGSDVNHLIFEVLPRLRSGVLVHFHDIFLPGEYPEDWIKTKRYFWNEQYLVHAFLMFNQQYHIILANAYLRSRRPDALAAAFPLLPRQNGGSLWLQRA